MSKNVVFSGVHYHGYMYHFSHKSSTVKKVLLLFFNLSDIGYIIGNSEHMCIVLDVTSLYQKRMFDVPLGCPPNFRNPPLEYINACNFFLVQEMYKKWTVTSERCLIHNTLLNITRTLKCHNNRCLMNLKGS